MADVVALTVTMLTNDWTSSNTDSVTPLIDELQDRKKVDVDASIANNGSVVLVGPGVFTQLPSGVNKTHVNTVEGVRIHIWSGATRAHAIKIKDEARRVLGAGFLNPYSGNASYRELEITSIDERNSPRRMWHWIVEAQAKEYHRSRSASL